MKWIHLRLFMILAMISLSFPLQARNIYQCNSLFEHGRMSDQNVNQVNRSWLRQVQRYFTTAGRVADGLQPLVEMDESPEMYEAVRDGMQRLADYLEHIISEGDAVEEAIEELSDVLDELYYDCDIDETRYADWHEAKTDIVEEMDDAHSRLIEKLELHLNAVIDGRNNPATILQRIDLLRDSST